MLFNSYTFIFLFLPLVLTGFYILKPAYRVGFLVAASLVFYVQWSVEHLMILLVSIVVNYLFSLILQGSRYKGIWLSTAIIMNLLPLIYFKYSLFLHLSSDSLMLPLAISFYTFQQIAFQVDLYTGKIKRGSFGEYLFFVLFFPQLVAGPIVHYQQIIEQVQRGALQRVEWHFIQAGIVLFSLGLFKKIVLADQFFPLANNAFGHIDTLTTSTAWIGLFAYSFGIYFDFSAYTDMAIGLGLLFGLRLPINFDSPYKAVNIVDFWRRWHITLSNFLRDYIYIPLGGSRHGESRVVLNLIITMTLGGIWHGAGWTFLLWGLLHGVLLSIVHFKNRHLNQWKIPRIAGILVTFVMVSLLWVLFRAHSLEEAWVYYKVLFILSGEGMPGTDLFWVTAGLGIVWLLPNSMEFVKYKENLTQFGWKHALVASVFAFAALKMMAEAPAQTFIYFNF